MTSNVDEVARKLVIRLCRIWLQHYKGYKLLSIARNIYSYIIKGLSQWYQWILSLIWDLYELSQARVLRYTNSGQYSPISMQQPYKTSSLFPKQVIKMLKTTCFPNSFHVMISGCSRQINTHSVTIWAAAAQLHHNKTNNMARCPGLPESLLGTKVILLVLSCSGSYYHD